jgi:hypothetical protein
MGDSNILLPSVPSDMRGPASLDPANGHIDPLIGSYDFPGGFGATNGEGGKDGGLGDKFSACFDHGLYVFCISKDQADRLHFTSKYKRLGICDFISIGWGDFAHQKTYKMKPFRIGRPIPH